MNMRADTRVVLLFSIVGLGSGVLSAILASFFSPWLWTAAGSILVLSLLISISIARARGWLSKTPSLGRALSASAVILIAYPISVLTMIGSLTLYHLWLSIALPSVWNEHVNAGTEPSSEWSLNLAAVVGALLVSIALRIITRRFDYVVMPLLIIAAVGTIPASQWLARAMQDANWHLFLFPVGQTLFSGLSGYWLLRANHT
jgi:hypothetical protein